MDSAASGMAALSLMIAIFAIILAILWILVPFAVFGIKPLLGRILAEQRKTNEFLAAISNQIHAASLLAVSPAPSPQKPDHGGDPAPPVLQAQQEREPTLAEIMRESKSP